MGRSRFIKISPENIKLSEGWFCQFSQSRVLHPGLRSEYSSGCPVGHHQQWLMTWFLWNWMVGSVLYLTSLSPLVLVLIKVWEAFSDQFVLWW